MKEPVKYRVLDVDSTDYGGNTMLLNCDSILYSTSYKKGQDSNLFEWDESLIKTTLNDVFINESYSTGEQIAIAKSYKADCSSTDKRQFTYFGAAVFPRLQEKNCSF